MLPKTFRVTEENEKENMEQDIHYINTWYIVKYQSGAMYFRELLINI